MKKRFSISQRAFCTAIGAFFLMSCAGFAGALGLFYLPVTEELGFSQTSFSAYMTVMSLVGILSHPLLGRLTLRHSRLIPLFAPIGGLLSLVVYVMWSLSNNLWLFYIGGGLMSFVLPIFGAQLSVTAVNYWFVKKRRLMVSCVTMGMSVGTVMFSQTARYFIDNFGWRSGYLAMGVLSLLMSIIAALLISPPPESLGMKPYGWDEIGEQRQSELQGMSLNEALKTRGFWIFSFTAVLGSLGVVAIQQSITPMFQVDYGFSAARAATLISIFSICCAVSKPIFGLVYEKGGMNVALIYISVFMTVSLVGLASFLGMPVAVAGVLVLGVGNMYGSIMVSSFVADVFGRKAYSAILGYVNIFYTVGASLGPIMAGAVADKFGSYRPAYYALAVISLLTCGFTKLAYDSVRKQKSARAAK